MKLRRRKSRAMTPMEHVYALVCPNGHVEGTEDARRLHLYREGKPCYCCGEPTKHPVTWA